MNFSKFSSTPIDLNTVTTSRVFTDGLNTGDNNGYSFTTQAGSSFNPYSDDWNNYAELDSIQDTDGNSIFAPGEITANSQFEGDINQSINSILDPVNSYRSTNNFSNWADASTNIYLQNTIGDRNTTNESLATDDNLRLSKEPTTSSVTLPIPTAVSTQTTSISNSTSSPRLLQSKLLGVHLLKTELSGLINLLTSLAIN